MRKALLFGALSLLPLLAITQTGGGNPIVGSILSAKKKAADYFTRGDFAKAQEYSFILLQWAEKGNDPYEEANACTMIAHLLNNANQAVKGIEYTRRAVRLLPRITEPAKKVDLFAKLSKRYLWHYQDTHTQGSLDSSGLFSRLTIAISNQEGFTSLLALAYNNLQGVEWEKGNLDKALAYLDSGKAYLDPAQTADMRVYFFDKADILLEQKKISAARKEIDSAIRYALVNGNQALLSETYSLAATIAKEQEDYKSAYEYHKKATSLNDSIQNAEKIRIVTELEKKYDQSQNENRIKDLDKKRQLYLLLAIAGLLAATAIAFYLRQQSLKHKKDILETEQRLNRARMNPHFFFNALSAMQKFAVQEKDGQALATNLSRFSKIMRETLESTYKEYVTIEQEFDFLQEYLEVQTMRFPGKFTYTLEADPELAIDDLLIPSMILQPFVENSIEHGFSGIGYKGVLTIHFGMDKKELIISIVDNGKGIGSEPRETNDHISRASQIIRDRIYLLNIKLKSRAGFRIDNNPGGQGVMVSIHLPILYKNNV